MIVSKESLKDLCPGRSSKVYIKPYEGGIWKELQGVIRDSITVEQRLPDAIEVSNFKPIIVKFTVKVNTKRIRKALLKLIGKPRKTTYKTLRKSCAKRNKLK